MYVDELDSFIGSKYNLLALFFKYSKLALEIFFGPCTKYQYHLTGPGKWDLDKGTFCYFVKEKKEKWSLGNDFYLVQVIQG